MLRPPRAVFQLSNTLCKFWNKTWRRNGFANRGPAPRKPEWTSFPWMRSRPRLQRRGRPGEKPNRSRAHDPGSYRHKHYRIGAVTTPQSTGSCIFAGSGRIDSTLCQRGGVCRYQEVIGRPRFRRDENVIAAALETIHERGLWVRPTEAVRACADPDDDIFLECAQAARAPTRYHSSNTVPAKSALQA